MPIAPPIHVDPARTRRRFARLQQYVEGNLLRDNKFVCCHYRACEASRRPGDDFQEGTMSHVGHRFDLRLGDKPLRIVVVGQEAADHKVTMDDRYQQVHDVTGLQHRYYADKEHPPRNPHMRGTGSALRTIFGKGLGADYEGEWVCPANGKPFHMFDGFALVNRLLCFAGPEDSSQGRGARTMLDNCGDHLTETLSILKPTILILQGKAAATWTQTALTRGREYSKFLHEAHLGQHRMVVCTFSHPSARDIEGHPPLRWGAKLDAPYLTDTVVPTLRDALRRF